MTQFKSFLSKLKPLDHHLVEAVELAYQTIFESDDDLYNELTASGITGDEYVPPEIKEPTKQRDIGRKVTAFHGSNQEFTSFDTAHIGKNFPNTKDGFFFSSDLDYVTDLANKLAKKNGGTPHIYTCELDLGDVYSLNDYFDTLPEKDAEHLYGVTNGDVVDIFDSMRNDIIGKFNQSGKDSIDFYSNREHLYVMFDPKRIKITDSKTFSITNGYGA